MKILKSRTVDGKTFHDVELTPDEVKLLQRATTAGSPPKASDTQIDGDHYRSMGDAQPWDVLSKWLTPEEYRGYQKGVAIAYLAREQSKGGDSDIRKAAHHLQRLIEEFPAPVKTDTYADLGQRVGVMVKAEIRAQNSSWSVSKDEKFFTTAQALPGKGPYSERIKNPDIRIQLIQGLSLFIEFAHGIAYEGGWWNVDGKDVRDQPESIQQLWAGAKLGLITTEVSEAIEGHRKGKQDDHLPEYPMWLVELGDTMIRGGDFAGGFASPVELARATVDKMVYNTSRLDHKPENRVKPGGKAY